MLEYQDAGFAVSYEERLWWGARRELVSGLWPVTSAGRTDQIQLTAMRETLVTAQICLLFQILTLFQRWTSESHVISKKNERTVKMRVWLRRSSGYYFKCLGFIEFWSILTPTPPPPQCKQSLKMYFKISIGCSSDLQKIVSFLQ